MSQISITVRGTDLQAAQRLLQRMYDQNQRSLPMMVFGSESGPIPAHFQDEHHPLTHELVAQIDETMRAVTTFVAVSEWHLPPDQVETLDVADERVVALRKRLTQEIARIPNVAQLRAERTALMNYVRQTSSVQSA